MSRRECEKVQWIVKDCNMLYLNLNMYLLYFEIVLQYSCCINFFKDTLKIEVVYK